jgi:hypothetical protein
MDGGKSVMTALPSGNEKLSVLSLFQCIEATGLFGLTTGNPFWANELS